MQITRLTCPLLAARSTNRLVSNLVITPNAADFAIFGVALLNPFERGATD
jgi:hypothetical protein